jgi:CubicO group peptidase (beta-lactamase class C family)
MEIHLAIIDAEGVPEPGAAETLVPWWSVTKTLIAAATLLLAERGRIALDVPLADHGCTPRQLLRHRAGLGDYGALSAYQAAVARRDPPWSDAELLSHVPGTPTLFAPDTGWSYSNVGYLLLRRLVEREWGGGLDAALHRLVLAPLGLRQSRLATRITDMDATAFAGGHGYDPGWVYHGTVVGPVTEAALALHRLLTGPLLAPASRAALLDRHPIEGPVEDRPWMEPGYGTGVMTGTMALPGMAPLAVVGHSAGGPGSTGAVYHAPETGRTAAAFAASEDGGVTERATLHAIFHRAFDSDLLAIRPSGHRTLRTSS